MNMDESKAPSKPIKLDYLDDKLVLAFDNNEHTKLKIKSLQGVRHNKPLKRWEASISCYNQIVTALDNLVISTKVIQMFAKEAELQRRVKGLQSDAYYELEDYAPKVPLMSHQKKQFELHRLLKGSASWSEMGSGKCLVSKDLQQINGKLIPAEDVWDTYSGISVRDQDGWWSKPKEELFVASLNEKGEIVKNKVKLLYRQKVNETLLRISLNDGSQVTITKAHKLHNLDKWTNKLGVGSRVSVPRRLPHESEDFDPKVAELFGWMIGDGCDSFGRSGTNSHEFTQKEKDSLNHVESLFKYVISEFKLSAKVRHSPPREAHRAPSITVCSEEFRKFCESLGYKWGNKSATKQVPDGVMTANKGAVAAFLRGFFDAEGHVSYKNMETCSASQLMMKQIGVLLRRFGIWMRTKKRKCCASNGTGIYRDYWYGYIGGPSAHIFKNEIGFFTDYKTEALSKLCQKTANSNVEGIPACSILQEIKRAGLPMRHIVGDYTIYFKGTQEPSRRVLQEFIHNIDKILDGSKRSELTNLPDNETLSAMTGAYQRTESFTKVSKELNTLNLLTKNGNRWYYNTVKKIITYGESFPYIEVYDRLDKEWLQNKRDQLQQLIDQEVHYAVIENIEEVDYDGWVYDLEIEPDHNYVAENIICHNTGSAICAIHWHLEMGNINKALVVCPKSVLRGWEEQIEFFSDLSYVSIVGTKRDKKLALDRNIYLINYEYTWRILDTLLDKSFNMVICDEAHRIKNPLAKQSKACYALGDASKYRIALTGTPVLNTSLDAFGVMRFVEPSIFGESFYSFRSKHFKNVGSENSPIKIYVPRKGSEEVISNALYTRALRFLKAQCLDLPEATHLPNRIITLSPDQDRAYRNLQEELSAQITEDESITITHVLTLMLKLSQVTSGWIKNTETQEIIRFKSNPKLEELKTLVEEAGDQPAIVWAYYIEDMRNRSQITLADAKNAKSLSTKYQEIIAPSATPTYVTAAQKYKVQLSTETQRLQFSVLLKRKERNYE